MLAPDPGSAGFSRPSRARWAPHLPGPSVGGGRLPRAGGEGAAPPSAFSEGRGAAGAVGAVQVPRPAPQGAAAFHSDPRLLTHFCTFLAEIKVLPGSLRAEGCGPLTPAGGRAVSRSRGVEAGSPLRRERWLPRRARCSANLCAPRRPAAEGRARKWFAGTKLRK